MKFRSTLAIILACQREGSSNDMDDTDGDRILTVITYVGFMGKGTIMKQKAVECVYETHGMPS